MAWWYDVIEARHELQNPTSAEKIRLLGQRLGLRPSSRVLDIASGKGGPARLLADEFGCRITCVERAPEFVAVACERASEGIEVIEADASTLELDEGAYDAALCLGALPWGSTEHTVRALKRPAREFVCVGLPYWREWPLPSGFELEEGEDFSPLPKTVERIESTGVEVVTLIASSEDDWDRYETLHWLALSEWLAANPDDPQADELRERGRHYKDRYLRWIRDLMGWGIFVCRT